MLNYKTAVVTVLAISLLALAGCGRMAGPGYSDNTPPKFFPAYFKHLTTFGNYDVNNPRMAEGSKDGQYAVIDPHGLLTLDIGHGLSFYSTEGPDVTMYMPNDRPANYTVHVRHVSDGEENWTEIGRGRGPADFDLEPYYGGAADYLQIRNEGTEPLYIDAVRAFSVRND